MDWNGCACITHHFQYIVCDYPSVIYVVTHPQTPLTYNYARMHSTIGVSHDALEHDSLPHVVSVVAQVRSQSSATTIAQSPPRALAPTLGDDTLVQRRRVTPWTRRRRRRRSIVIQRWRDAAEPLLVALDGCV